VGGYKDKITVFESEIDEWLLMESIERALRVVATKSDSRAAFAPDLIWMDAVASVWKRYTGEVVCHEQN